ncbi:hypothetical protein F0562_029479 [Nyssa sinensis]|uniref:Uncharacterized protein n=1 Tax=Nyssa sinensis TaxID=561372 RepID=A0A5J5B760_9ASTE|nr:hypothetical protein F0562_029479 [Nyssa sinensis]
MVNTISNVDPNKYSYIELLQDVGELSLSHVSTVIGFAINLHCDIPGSNDKMIVSSDLDVLKMFEIHNSREINIYVTTMSAVLCHTVDVSETVTVSSQSSEDEISISDSDDVYGLTSEDEAFVPSVGENLSKSTCNTTTSPSVNVEVHGGDDFSYFDSNDDDEYNPSLDDNSIDKGESEGKGKGKSTSRVFEYDLYGEESHVREGDKIVLKSGQLFENVDKFREGLDRVIAETFPEATHRRCCRHLCANMRIQFLVAAALVVVALVVAALAAAVLVVAAASSGATVSQSKLLPFCFIFVVGC